MVYSGERASAAEIFEKTKRMFNIDLFHRNIQIIRLTKVAFIDPGLYPFLTLLF